MRNITSQGCVNGVFSVNLLNVIYASFEVSADELSDCIVGKTRENSAFRNTVQVFLYFELEHL